MKRILFLVPYPLGEAPSQRFRFEQYLEKLEQNNYLFAIQSFLDNRDWRIFYSRGNLARKGFVLLKGFMKRFLILFRIFSYDYIFIHREVAPVGPPIFEWIIRWLGQKKIIYDFDDSIWLTDQKNEPRLVRLIKWRSKVKKICRWAHKVSCGNAYLCAYASQVNEHTILNPTTIDIQYLHNSSLYPKKATSQVIVGWTGTHSTLKYLLPLEEILGKILLENPHVKLNIIADYAPSLSIPYTFTPWTKETEIIDLCKFDIGLMPLPDDEWSKGKCGFKALQYMALEIPAVASPVGVNTKIIKNGVTGYLCETETDWREIIRLLIADKNLRTKIGNAGRRVVQEYYSVESNSSNFLSLFE